MSQDKIEHQMTLQEFLQQADSITVTFNRGLTSEEREQVRAHLMQLTTSPDQSSVWRCYHCGEVLSTPEAAAEHFGQRRDDPPKCEKLYNRLNASNNALDWCVKKLLDLDQGLAIPDPVLAALKPVD